MRKVDVAIIGAGTAGLTARSEVAKETDDYLVIDDGILGTTCARVGCMPSKALLQVAQDFHRRKQLQKVGIHGSEGLNIHLDEVMEHTRKLRDRFVDSVLRPMKVWEDKLIRKRARFIDPHTLDLTDEKIQADKIIIATGSHPAMPQEWEEYREYLIDTDRFFELEKLPSSVIVVGLGVIGLELGQALSRLGIETTAFTRNQRIGGLTDPDIQEYATGKFSEEFEIIMGSPEVLGEKDGMLTIQADGKERSAERIFLSMGRRPNIKDLGLENLGVPLNERSLPAYDPATCQIHDLPVYIAGDVTSEKMILHEAADEGRIAGYNAVHGESASFERKTPLNITFSDPNICIAGKRYKELKESEVDFVTGKVSFEGQGRAIVKLKETGLLHVYAERKDGRILGAEIFAPEGEHLAHLLAWAITFEKNVFELLECPFYHPVLEEGLRTALRNLSKKVEAKH